MRVARLSSLAAALLLAGILPAATAAPVTEQPPERLTLSEVLAAARTSAPALLAARSREAAATAAAAVAGRWTNPEIEIRSENWGAQDHELPLDSFATVRQALELGGKRGARRHAAETAAVTAGVGTLGALREIEGQVAGRFLDAVRQRDRAALRREQIESLDELLRILDRRVEEGSLPKPTARVCEWSGRRSGSSWFGRKRRRSGRSSSLPRSPICRVGSRWQRSNRPGKSRCPKETRKR